MAEVTMVVDCLAGFVSTIFSVFFFYQGIKSAVGLGFKPRKYTVPIFISFALILICGAAFFFRSVSDAQQHPRYQTGVKING